MTKTVIDDQIRIIVKPKDSADLLAFFKTVLSLLSGSFLPQPDKIIQPNGLNYAINGFLDPLVMTTLEQETGETKNAFELIYRDRENIQVISPSGNLYSLTEHQYLPDRFPSLLRALVISIAEEAAPVTRVLPTSRMMEMALLAI